MGCFRQISTGGRFVCGIRAHTQDIECWGQDVVLDYLDNDWLTVPSGEFVEVASGDYHVCARRLDGTVTCWGDGAADPPGWRFVQISAGWANSCGLREDGMVDCWGGEASSGHAEPPTGQFLQVTVGAGNLACGLRPDGSVDCWGGPKPGDSILSTTSDRPVQTH